MYLPSTGVADSFLLNGLFDMIVRWLYRALFFFFSSSQKPVLIFRLTSGLTSCSSALLWNLKSSHCAFSQGWAGLHFFVCFVLNQVDEQQVANTFTSCKALYDTCEITEAIPGAL